MECSAAPGQGQYRLYSSAWLEGLKLMAVQPACLTAHPIAHANQGTGFQRADDVIQLEQHELLLHLSATLTVEHPAAQADSAAAAAVVINNRQARALLPLLLQHAVLDLIVLSRQMQLLQHQQISLLKLLQQHASIEDATAGASSSASNPSSRSRGNSTALLNLHTSIKCPPSEHLMDCLHLVLMLSSSEQQQQQQQLLSAEAQAVEPAVAPAVPAGVVIADVPLLMLPAAAQQEVQQLLLPAMRQEVQAEQQQQQQQGGGQSPQDSAEQCQRACLAVEHAAWKHFSNLAQDIYTVIQLAWVAAAPEAAAAVQQAANDSAALTCARQGSSSSAAAGVAPAAAAAAATFDDVGCSCAVLSSQDSSAAAAALTPAAALAQLADTLLFPLLLPFLAAQGMQHMLQLLLLCLPLHLREQWQQQQQGRLQQLADASPPLQPPVAATAAEAQQSKQRHAEAAKQQQQQQEQQPPTQQQQQAGLLPLSFSLDDHSSVCDCELLKVEEELSSVVESSSQQQQQQQQQAVTDTKQQQQELDLSADSKLQQHAETGKQQQCKLQQQADLTTGAAAATAISNALVHGGVPWYLPLAQFADGVTESRYVAWKHLSLLHLDYVAAWFGLVYLAVMLRRLMHEPASLFYFAVILTKLLPHIPLVLGMRDTFLRYRETWLLMVAPTMALIALLLSLPSVAHGQPALLLPNRAYRAYWNSRGELQTTVMRPFTQHMRLRPYIAYTLLDAALSAWVFGQVFGIAAAVTRWGFASVMSIALSWGLDLYMRRRFVRTALRHGQQQQQQQ